MAEKACASCGKMFPESDLFLSDRGEICAECDLKDTTAAHAALEPGMFHPAYVVGVIAGLAPFLVEWRHITVDGQGHVLSFMDYGAIAGGGVAALAGIVGLGAALRADAKKTSMIIAAVVVLGLGALQLLRGFGIL